MTNKTSLRLKQKDTESTTNLIIDSIQDIKGKNIIQLDLRNVTGAPAEFFIICEGESTVQVSSIAGNIYKRMKNELGYTPISYEGRDHAKWILIDYFDVVVHIFHPETREFYNLEALWNDAEFTNFEDL